MRKARCIYFKECEIEVDSNPNLGFFEDQTEGTNSAALCVCGYYETAHTNKWVVCVNYSPRGDIGYDQFYCGCRGCD